jgi:uncharacterized protein DUF4145
MVTFIIDCPYCKAKVGAQQHGIAEYFTNEHGEAFGERVYVGKCPQCKTILVGRAEQTHFAGYMGDEDDAYSDVVRVYPQPPKTFTSYRIPRALNQSLLEADRSFQAGANIAACVMLGRALEALCRDILQPEKKAEADKPKRRVMLGSGIKELREKKIIDDRLYDWSVSLQAMRNLAAHPEDITVSRQDVEDLQAFVYAITEYVYDLTDRYNEFKEREAENKKPRPSAAEMFADVIPKPE